MIASVEEIKVLTAKLLGDPNQRKYTNDVLQPFFELAYEELTGEMARYHIAKQRRAVSYALAANTTSLTPLTAGISNFGELVRLEERPYLSGDTYIRVTPVTRLPQRAAQPMLTEFEWRNDTWYFVGATQAIDLLITYYDSGAAPTTGSVGIDGSKNFLAYRAAAVAAEPHGHRTLAESYDREARGPARDGGGGHMHRLIQAMITTEQQIQLQLPFYRAEERFPLFVGIGTIDTNGGSSVGIPTLAVLTGAIDGSNDTFTLASAPARLFLYLNGALLDEGTGYTIVGNVITMAPAYIPQSGDSLRAEVW